MKKIFIIIICSFLSIALLGAFEGGGLIKNNNVFSRNSKGSKSSSIFSNYSTVSLWAQQALDAEGNKNFRIQSSYYCNIGIPISSKTEKQKINHLVDLDLLQFSFLFPLENGTSALFDVGRTSITDVTKIIFNQPVDGMNLLYKGEKADLFFNLGYTGLLNRYIVRINSPVSPKKTNEVYSVAPGFITSMARISVPLNYHKYTIAFEGIFCIDPHHGSKGNHTGFFTAALNGSLMPGLFFLTGVSANVRNEIEKTLSGIMLSFDLNYYFKKFDSKIGFNSLFSTGGDESFLPFSQTLASKIEALGYTNLLKLGFNGSFKPFEGLFIGADANALFNTWDGFKTSPSYNALEMNIFSNYTILEDLMIGFHAGHMFEKNGANFTTLSLRGIISF